MARNKKQYGRKKQKKYGKTVFVQNDNVQKALRKLRRKLDKNQLFDQLREKRYFKKPSQIKKRKKSIAKWKAKIWMQNKKREQKENY